MIRRSAVIASEVFIGLLAVTVLLAGLAIWRLSTGPVDLDFLTPEIERALSDPGKGVEVRIGRTQLTWGGWERTVDLHARRVRIFGADGTVLAALPDVVLRLSLRALVQGTIAPTLVEIFGAHVSVTRRQDGSFQFGPWDETGAVASDEAAPEGDFSRLVPEAIARLLAQPTPDDPLSFLRILRIAGGRVSVNDRKLGIVWTAPYADIELRRDEDGLSGEVALKVDLGERQASIFALLDYSKAAEQIDLTARFSDVVPKTVVSLAPGLTAVGDLTMPLAGSVAASLTPNGTLKTLDFDIRGGVGEFAQTDLFAVPVAVTSLRANGSIVAPERRMTLESAVIEFGDDNEPGPRVTLSGQMTSAAEGFRGDLEVSVLAVAENVPMARLGRYWPLGVAENPRGWVLTNVDRGVTQKATLKASLTAPGGDFSAAEVHELGGTLDYAGIAVHFLRPMPPVTGISGSADFDDDRMTFRPNGGRLGELEIQEASIEITGLKPAKEAMTIDIAAVGPLQDTLKLLDHDRLKLIRKLGIEAESLQGLLAARVGFKFLLLKDLGIDDIDVSAAANLAQVSAKGLLLGQDITDGQLKVALDKTGMHLTGPVTFAGIGMDVNWSEAFTDDAAELSRIEVLAERLDAKGRAALGIDLSPYLTGPLSAHVIARRDKNSRTVVDAAFNLRDTRLEVAPVPWEKPAGVEGSAELSLELSNGRPRRIGKLDIDAGTLRARGTADMDGSGAGLDKLAFSDLAFDATALTGVEIDLTGKKLGVRIRGGVLDVTPWLADEPEPKDRAAPGVSEPGELQPMPLSLTASALDAAIFGPNRYLEQVSIEVERSPLGWEKVLLRGAVPKALWHSPKGTSGADLSGKTLKTLVFDYGPALEGGKRLLITSEDMGAVLRALDAADTINGGRLEISGTSEGPLPGAKLNARIEGRDYVLVGAPNMARLLTLASLTGISDLLNGEGIGFQRLTGDFTLENGVMSTELIRAYGPAIGLTTKGTIDFDRDEIALQGTIVPAYTVNRIIGEIPLLGPLLTGGEGEGVFAATYQMSGPVSEPKVSVNPLAALAPGFLRSLFSGSSVDAGEARALPEKIDP